MQPSEVRDRVRRVCLEASLATAHATCSELPQGVEAIEGEVILDTEFGGRLAAALAEETR